MAKYLKSKKISVFDIVNNALVILVTVVVLYPLYFCVIASFSDPVEVSAGNTLLWVKGFNIKAWVNVLKEDALWRGYRNTIFYTVGTVLYSLALILPLSYGLSKKYLPFRNALCMFFFITMYVGGGLIPNYLLIKELHLLNSPLVMVVGGVGCYHIIITRMYFANSINSALYEAAYIDGASEWKGFCKIALPLAKPIIAVEVLYHAVGCWNNYYTALIYIQKEAYMPLQSVLRSILLSNEMYSVSENATAQEMAYALARVRTAQSMKYSTIIIASIPLLIAYPFVQKYFTKGVMIGSVKG